MSTKPIVFILNNIRSGSTLLKSMLDMHPDIFAPSELNILPYKNLEDAKTQLKGTGLENGIEEAVSELLGVPISEAEKITRGWRSHLTSPLEVYQFFQNNLNGSYFIDKSPTNCTSIHTLEKTELLTTADGKKPLYIFLTRHPFDIFSSCLENNFDKLLRRLYLNYQKMIKEKKYYPPDSFINPYVHHLGIKVNQQERMDVIEGLYQIIMWNIQAFLQHIPKERKHYLTYESLVTNPVIELKSLCNFLGIQFCQLMLNPYRGKSKIGRAMDPNFYQHHKIESLFKFKWLKEQDKWLNCESVYKSSTFIYGKKTGYDVPTTTLKEDLSTQQQAFFKRYENPKGYFIRMDLMIDSSKALTKEALSSRLFVLMQKHDVLRMYFKDTKDGWMQFCLPRPPCTDIQEVDIGHLKSSADITNEINRQIELLVEEIKLHTAPLFRVALFRLANKQTCIIYLFHHLIIDGRSMMQFHRELWSQTPISTSALTKTEIRYDYLTYTVDTNFLKRSTDFTGVLKDWKELLKIPNSKIKEIFNNSAKNTYITQKTFHQSLKLEQKGFAFYSIAQALYSTACSFFSTDWVNMAINLNRRYSEDFRYSSVLGWIAGDVPFLTLQNFSTSGDFKFAFNKTLKTLLANPLIYDWLYTTENVPAVKEICPILFNYYPLSLRGKAFSIFNKIDVSLVQSQDTLRQYFIDFIVRDYNGELDIYIRYSSNIFSKEEITEFYLHWYQIFQKEWRCSSSSGVLHAI